MQINKLQISLSSPTLEQISYTGNNGLYAHRKVLSTGPLEDMCRRLGLETDPDSMHVTLMYSTKVPGTTPHPRNGPIAARLGHVSTWVGHNGKTYCVCNLISDALHNEHSELTRLGCSHSYCPYGPHVTLAKDVTVTDEFTSIMEQINRDLIESPAEIELDAQFIGDLKD